MNDVSVIKEGGLYRSLNVRGTTFNIHYGYYSDAEREIWEPAPIFPDFIKQPQFTELGEPYTTADQDICEHFEPKPQVSGENWCNDCIFFSLEEEIIGICKCIKRQSTVCQCG